MAFNIKTSTIFDITEDASVLSAALGVSIEEIAELKKYGVTNEVRLLHLADLARYQKNITLLKKIEKHSESVLDSFFNE